MLMVFSASMSMTQHLIHIRLIYLDAHKLLFLWFQLSLTSNRKRWFSPKASPTHYVIFAENVPRFCSFNATKQKCSNSKWGRLVHGLHGKDRTRLANMATSMCTYWRTLFKAMDAASTRFRRPRMPSTSTNICDSALLHQQLNKPLHSRLIISKSPSSTYSSRQNHQHQVKIFRLTLWITRKLGG